MKRVGGGHGGATSNNCVTVAAASEASPVPRYRMPQFIAHAGSGPAGAASSDVSSWGEIGRDEKIAMRAWTR
ncbi:hypothetical protein [Actinomadura hallensis]|uniref:hypothetical protein n=1 Tax=Actinomadura hallensis TaxID=337895 RepID=UPI0011524E95|nr:hypothetical protein [Actinomadura hallensis]